ncbi:hypothetical protein AB670_03151 [Chryseobacterium sp. MOF25P]|jgi:hypothetical protein|nr:hypothetical protein AB670_03151 [Chryseobacterium sp. MOF25P]OBW46769.1 hypothetical protein AB671_01120 [Chryseobacterium sp. BGARF1]
MKNKIDSFILVLATIFIIIAIILQRDFLINWVLIGGSIVLLNYLFILKSKNYKMIKLFFNTFLIIVYFMIYYYAILLTQK